MKSFIKSAMLLSLLITPSFAIASADGEPGQNHHAQRRQNENVHIDQDQEFVESLQKALEAIDCNIPEKVDQAIFLVGNAGVGKSTLFNYLQHDLESIIDGMEVKFRQKGQEDFLRGVSGSSLSQTKIPAFAGCYCDCPSFGDNRGAQQAIANAYAIHRVLKSTPKIQIMLTASQSELDNRSGSFLNVLNRLGQIFSKDVEKLETSFSLVVTKFQDPYLETKDAIKFIKEDLKNIYTEQEGMLDLKTLTLLSYFSDQDKNNVQIFRRPVRSIEFKEVDGSAREAIRHMLDSAQFAEVTPTLSIDPEAKAYLEEFYQRWIFKINEKLEEVSKKTHTNIKDFIKNGDKSAQDYRNKFKELGKNLRSLVKVEYRDFTTNVREFFETTQDIFPNSYEKTKNYLIYLEFLERFNIKLESCQKSTKRIVDFSMEHMQKIVDWFNYLGTCSSQFELNNGKLTLTGAIVAISDLPEVHSNSISQINLYSSHSLFIDSDVKAPGAYIKLFAPYWFMKGDITFNLSGGDRQELQTSDPAVSHGQNGGNVYGHFLELNGDHTLSIIANGLYGGKFIWI